MEAVNLFVYGSLRQGMGANYMMGGEPIHVGKITDPGFMLVNAGGAWPGVVTNAHDDRPDIVGEVYSISDPVILNRLDMYEGYPGLFDKTQVEVQLEDGSSVECTMYVYVYDSDREWPEALVIPDGDWVKYREAS